MDVTKIEAAIKTDLTWLQKHERLVLAVIAGLVLWFAIGKIDTLIANHDHANLQQAQVAAQVQEEKNQAYAEQVAKDKAAYEALAAKVEARDAQLVQLQAQLVSALTKQQAADKVMTPTELTQRWNKLVPEASVSVINNQIVVPAEGARATVVELEKAPVLAQQLAAKDEQLDNTQALLTAKIQQVSSLVTEVGGLQEKATLDAKVCRDEIKVVKDDARKSKKRWFIAGVVTTVVIRVGIRLLVGL